MYRLFAVLLAAASCPAVVQAQMPPQAAAGDVMTLDQALAAADAVSPAADAAEAGVRAADQARVVAGLRPNPTLDTQVENVAGSRSYRGVRSSETTVSLALPIEMGGKRSARIGVADAVGRRARVEASIARADIRLAVTRAYAEAVASERRLAVAEAQARVAAEGLRVAADLVQVGATSPIDEQRAQVVKVNADAGLERARRAVDVARINLGLLTGGPVAGLLDRAWFDRIQGHGPRAPATADGTLTLAAASADLAAAGARVRLAQAQRVPDLTVSAGTRRLEATNDVAALFGVSIPIPIRNSGRAALGQAQAERAQAEAQRRVALLETQRAIAAAEAEVANAATAARAAGGPALAAATEAARIARIGYGQGKFDQIALLDAERTLAETNAAAIDALVAYHDAMARLERLTAPAPILSGDNDDQ